MNDDSSEARTAPPWRSRSAAQHASSDAWPQATATGSTSFPSANGRPRIAPSIRLCIGVSMEPGHIAFTRTFCSAHSECQSLRYRNTPPFDAQYGMKPAKPSVDAIEPMSTIEPPCPWARIRGTAARQAMNVPVRCTQSPGPNLRWWCLPAAHMCDTSGIEEDREAA